MLVKRRMVSVVGLLAFLLFTTALTGYARWRLGYPRCGTDEQNYLHILSWLDQGGVWPVSGPGYVLLIQQIRTWMGWDAQKAVVAMAVIASSVVLPLGLWVLYHVALGTTAAAWRCFLWLFVSSYFLGPWLEGRPQQLGMLLTMLGAWRGNRDLQERGTYSGGFWALWIICLGYHALSFVVLTGLIFGLWAFRFVERQAGYKALVLLLVGLAGNLALSAWWYPLIWLDIRINHVRGIAVGQFLEMLVLMGTVVLVLLHILRYYALIPILISWLRGKWASRCVLGGLAFGASAALFWQYTWLGPLYRDVHLLHLLMYHSGNVLLAGLVLIGLRRLSREPAPELVFFLQTGTILLAGAGIFLILTPWLRDHNFALRLLNYWTWYAAPLAAWGWSGFPRYWRLGIALFSPLSLIGGVHHVVEAPTWTCAIG